jgi:hypothetical protein
MESKKDEFKRPLAKPSLKLQLPSDGSQASSAANSSSEVLDGSQEHLRASLSRSDASLIRVSGNRKSASGSVGSPRSRPVVARTVSNVYSPRWILNVKRESDKQVRAFLDSLPQSEVQTELRKELEEESDKFLQFKTDNLGVNTTAMVLRLQRLLTRAASSKEKQMVVQLLLIISSCSRLDMYIASVREAEDSTSNPNPAQISARSGYDGQMEYRKLDSPRLRDSATKRANFLSLSMGQDQMDTYLELMSTGPSSPSRESDDSVICRICENYIPKTIYQSHVKFCGQKGAQKEKGGLPFFFLFFQL